MCFTRFPMFNFFELCQRAIKKNPVRGVIPVKNTLCTLCTTARSNIVHFLVCIDKLNIEVHSFSGLAGPIPMIFESH